jgi:uncharacterized protein
MDITPLIPKDKKIVTGYGGGAFKVNNESYSGSVIIYPGEVFPWKAQDASDINITSLAPLLETTVDIELLIIGCGNEHIKLPAEISKAFREKNISVEIMTTGAACRTYNVLLGEGRQIAAALVAV